MFSRCARIAHIGALVRLPLALSSHSCTLYGAQCSVIECSTVQRTLLAVIFAVLLTVADLCYVERHGRRTS
jgi:hypothetical protein